MAERRSDIRSADTPGTTDRLTDESQRAKLCRDEWDPAQQTNKAGKLSVDCPLSFSLQMIGAEGDRRKNWEEDRNLPNENGKQRMNQ